VKENIFRAPEVLKKGRRNGRLGNGRDANSKARIKILGVSESTRNRGEMAHLLVVATVPTKRYENHGEEKGRCLASRDLTPGKKKATEASTSARYYNGYLDLIRRCYWFARR